MPVEGFSNITIKEDVELRIIRLKTKFKLKSKSAVIEKLVKLGESL